MKAVITKKVPCKLEGGELRRVPQNPKGWIVAYHVCCPRCGFVTLAVNGCKELEIKEEKGLVTFSKPLRCTYCQVLIHLDRGEFKLEGDDRVQRVRYR